MKTLLSICLFLVAGPVAQAQCWNPFVPATAAVAYPMTTTYFNGNSATTINFGRPVYAPTMTTTYFSGNSATTINFGGRIAPVAPAVPYVAPIVPTFTPVVAPRFQSAFCFD
jgi:hypothetical protein